MVVLQHIHSAASELLWSGGQERRCPKGRDCLSLLLLTYWYLSYACDCGDKYMACSPHRDLGVHVSCFLRFPRLCIHLFFAMLQISDQCTCRRQPLLWAPTRPSLFLCGPSMAGFWCRGRSPVVQCLSTTTGLITVTGSDRQHRTTTGWDLTRSTAWYSLATPDWESR